MVYTKLIQRFKGLASSVFDNNCSLVDVFTLYTLVKGKREAKRSKSYQAVTTARHQLYKGFKDTKFFFPSTG